MISFKSKEMMNQLSLCRKCSKKTAKATRQHAISSRVAPHQAKRPGHIFKNRFAALKGSLVFASSTLLDLRLWPLELRSDPSVLGRPEPQKTLLRKGPTGTHAVGRVINQQLRTGWNQTMSGKHEFWTWGPQACTGGSRLSSNVWKWMKSMGSDGELQTGATQERGIHMQLDQIASAGLGRNEPQQIQQAPMGLPKENPGLFFLPTDKKKPWQEAKNVHI